MRSCQREPRRINLDRAANLSQVIAETDGRRLSALCKEDVKWNLASQGNTSAHEFGLAALGVADALRKREDVASACDRHKQHAIVIAEALTAAQADSGER